MAMAAAAAAADLIAPAPRRPDQPACQWQLQTCWQRSLAALSTTGWYALAKLGVPLGAPELSLLRAVMLLSGSGNRISELQTKRLHGMPVVLS